MDKSELVRGALVKALALLLGASVGGCAQERRELGYWTPLSGVPGSFRGSDDPLAGDPQRPDGVLRGAAAQAEAERLFEVDPRGRERLRLASPGLAMGNLRRLLRMEDVESGKRLMVEQLLSRQTFEQMYREGRGREEAASFFFENRQDVLATLARMPFGEQSPDVAFERAEGKLYQLRLRRGPARGLVFDSLWLALEGAEWKVVWLSPASGEVPAR